MVRMILYGSIGVLIGTALGFLFVDIAGAILGAIIGSLFGGCVAAYVNRRPSMQGPFFTDKDVTALRWGASYKLWWLPGRIREGIITSLQSIFEDWQ